MAFPKPNPGDATDVYLCSVVGLSAMNI